MFPDDDWILVESYNIKMFIFEVTVVLYSIKILSGSRNFYRLRMTSLTYVNECFHDFMFVNKAPPPPRPASLNLVLQHGGKPWKVSIALFVDYSSPIRGLFVLFVDYSRTIRTIRRLFVLFVDYSRTIRTIRRLFALFALFASLF